MKTTNAFIKRLFLVISAVFAVASFAPAQDMTEEDYGDSGTINLGGSLGLSGKFIYDGAGILTDREIERLDKKARAMSEAHGLGIYVLTVSDYTDWGWSIEDASEAIFYEYNLGVGDERNCISLILSMEDRSYDLDAYGYGNTAFTDYGKQELAKVFLDDFKNNDWYAGFSDYIAECGKYLTAAEEGSPVDNYYAEDTDDKSFLQAILDSLLKALGGAAPIGLIISGLKISSEKKKMNNIATATEANKYVSEDGVDFKVKNDIFKYTTTHTRIIQTDTTGRGGGHGGGTTISSSGHSHSSGHF